MDQQQRRLETQDGELGSQFVDAPKRPRDVGIQQRETGSLEFTRSGMKQSCREHGELRINAPRDRDRQFLMNGVAESPKERDNQRLDLAVLHEAPDCGLGVGRIEWSHDASLAVYPFRHAHDRVEIDDGRGCDVPAFVVDHATAARKGNHLLESRGRHESHALAGTRGERIGDRRGAEPEARDLGHGRPQRFASPFGRQRRGGEHALADLCRRGR